MEGGSAVRGKPLALFLEDVPALQSVFTIDLCRHDFRTILDMSNDILKADQIAFHFYTKLFYIVNNARATEGSKAQQKVDKWFNLETLDSDLFTKEAREPYRNISQAPSTGPAPLHIQVVLSVPELANNQVLVCMSPDSPPVRIEPTPKFIVLETWTLECTPHRAGYDDHFSNSNMDIALPIIYKHGIILFRSVYSLLRILPAWKFHKRLRRRTAGANRYGNFSILLRVRPLLDGGDDRHILDFNSPPSPHSQPFTTSTHTFPPISHILGIFTLSTTYLDKSTFQLDELESLLSSKFISLDREEFVPTLEKNRQRDSISGSSLPSSTSGPKSGFSRSPPMQIARATSSGGAIFPGIDNISVAERFVLPPVIGTSATTGTSALIPPPRPFPTMSPSTANVSTNPSGLAISRLRKESMNSSSSSLISIRDNLIGTSSLSSSPSTGPLLIRKPSIFKANTISSASGSSPSLSIRQVPSSLSREGVGPISSIPPGTGGTHSRQSSHNSPIVNLTRLPPSPIGTGFSGTHTTSTGTPSSLGDKRPDMSGNGAGFDRDRRISMNSIGFGLTATEDGEFGPVPMPQRKRYSSSFGHRYAGSGGSSSGTGMVVGSAGSGGAVIPTLGASRSSRSPASRTSAAPSGRNTPASVFEGRKEDSMPYLGTTTDDDEISVFVQDIDSRKPLSGRIRQLEKFDNVLGDPSSKQGQGHDRETTETIIGSKLRETTTASPHEFRRHRLVDRQSPFPIERAVSLPSEVQPSTAVTEVVVASSTSPPRGLILTSQGEVDERLSKMKEAFLRSLEGLGGNGTRRKEKEKEKTSPTTTSSSSKTSSTVTPFERTSINDSPPPGLTSGQDNRSPLASRGMNLGYFSPRQQPLETKSTGPYGYNLGGISRGRYTSTSSSLLGSSDVVGMSQGSEEVIGRMDLYDERRRPGYQG